jgi:hypothetical protein
MARLRSFSKHLTCPRCGDVIGRATLRPLTGWLNIELAGGGLGAPSEGAVQLRVAEARLHAAASPDEQAEAQRQIEFVKRAMGEQIYDLRCPHGHHAMVTTPQIIRAMRQAGGDWASLPVTT